jgi:hypothetical protein
MEHTNIVAYLKSLYTYMLHAIRDQVCDSLFNVNTLVLFRRPPEFSKFSLRKTDSGIVQGHLGLDINVLFPQLSRFFPSCRAFSSVVVLFPSCRAFSSVLVLFPQLCFFLSCRAFSSVVVLFPQLSCFFLSCRAFSSVVVLFPQLCFFLSCRAFSSVVRQMPG